MNDPLYLEELSKLPGDLPWITGHISPAGFHLTRERLLPLVRRL